MESTPANTNQWSDGLSIERELLRLAFARMPQLMLATAFASVLFTAIWWQRFPQVMLLLWSSLILVFGVAVRYFLWLSYQSASIAGSNTRRFEKLYFLQTLSTGFAWGLGPTLMMPQATGAEPALFIAMLFAVCGVGINTLSAQRGAMQGFVMAGMVPTAVSAVFSGGEIANLMALTLLVGMVSFITIGRATNQATRELVFAQLRLRDMLDTALDAVIESDEQGCVTDWNLQAEVMFGWTKIDMLGRSLANTIVPPAHREAHQKGMSQFVKTGEQHVFNRRVELTALRKNGDEFPIELAITPVKLGDRWLFTAFVVDVSESQRAARALKESEERFRNLIELSPEATAVQRDGVLLYVNPAAVRMFGANTDRDLVGKPVLTLIHPDCRSEDCAWTQARAIDDLTAPLVKQLCLRLDGAAIHVEIQAKLMTFDGAPAVYASMRDVTQAMKSEEAMRIAATAFESQQGMTITDANSVILQVNKAFTEITGYAAHEVIGKTPRVLSSGRHDSLFYQSMWAEIAQNGKWQGEIWNRHKDGDVFPEWLTVTAVKDDSGTVTHYVAAFSDISQHKAAERQIRNLAFYDPLTELPNRRLLMDRLKQALAALARHKKPGALLFIDLDNFKNINDTLGHHKGDVLLQQVAQRLCNCVREGDTVARLGGDEFVLMLEELDESAPDAAATTELVGMKILTALGEPYLIDDRECRTSPSIGVTLFTDPLDNVDELLKRADLAMYQAKAAGRNTIRFFDPHMQAVVEANALLEAELRLALELEQFQLHYQAQVAQDGRIVGAEVLVRWLNPDKGMVSPAQFIPMAEQTGLILPLGAWVLETACQQISLWSSQLRFAELAIAVNVSARQFRQDDFVDQVLAILMRTGANPQRLKLELTESLLIDDIEDVIAKMTALKSLGVGFSLDDFGTGYSSLAYLSRLPLDQLKIDQGFVRDIETSDNAVVICAATISLAHSLKLKVVAEGVETMAQRYFLSTMHRCDFMQGYLFSRPVPLSEFERLVNAAALPQV